MALLQTIGWKISKKSRQQQSLHRTHFDRGHGAGGSNNDTVFDGIEIPSGQGIVFYGNGVTFQGHLPNYLSYDRPYRSFRLYLTFVDCHRALIASIYKARLILFELKQRAFSLKSGRIVLDGTPRRLDEDFVKDMHRLEESLVRPHCVGTLLDRLLSAHLRLHPRYEKESATLQTSLLGVDKAFRMHVVEPLKSALVDSKNEPDYGRLHATNKGLQRLALVTCRQWSDSVGKMGDEIKVSPAWKQAEELAGRIKELQMRAVQHGWLEAEDSAYKTRVGPEQEIFDTIEGPDKAIAYLEDWCQRAET